MHHHRLARDVRRALCPHPLRERSCGKRRYPDRIAADLALALIRSQGSARWKDPVRSYLCPGCDGWHLTAKRAWQPPIPTPRAPIGT